MNTDNTQDGAEPSPASAGSHVALHRAVRALLDGVNARYAKNPREWTCPYMQALDDMTQSEPQPTLADEERKALKKVLRRVRENFAGRFADGVEVAAVIDGLLERTK
jgi:hypothetical protein